MKRHYYNFEINNDTDHSLICDKTDRLNYPLLDKQNDYSLSILKFSLPSEQIECFRIQNPTTYGVKLVSNCTYTSGYVFNLSGFGYLPTSDNYKYLNHEQLIEQYNRAVLRAHRDLLFQYDQYTQNVVNITGSFTAYRNSPPYQWTQNLTIPAQSDPLTGYVGYVRLTIKFKGRKNMSGSYRDYPIVCWLQSPDNTKCLVYAGNTDRDHNTAYTFEDGSAATIGMGYTNNQNWLQAGTYQPREAFLKFNTRNNNAIGNWKIIIQSLEYFEKNIGSPSPDFDMDVDYDLQIYFTPKGFNNEMNIAQLPPTLNYNETTNKLEMIVHETSFYGNNSINFTPKLNNILGFETALYDDPTSSEYGLYRLKYPQLILSSTITPQSFVNLTQPISTLYKLNNIQAIQIRSSTIPVSGEYSVNSGSQIIMSVDIPAGDIKNRYEYSATINRHFELIGGDLALTDINFNIWVSYLNNEESLVQLPPYSKFTLLCCFIPNDKTSN